MVQRMSAQAEIRDSATYKSCAHQYEHPNEIAPETIISVKSDSNATTQISTDIYYNTSETFHYRLQITFEK